MNRQRLILFILVILFGIAIVWSYNATPRQKTVSKLTYKPGQQEKTMMAATEKSVRNVDDGTRLKIELLDKEQSEFKGYRRDIFKPVFIDEMKVVKKAVVIKPQPPKVPVLVEPPVMQKPVAPPLAQFTVIGFLKRGAVRTIFLTKDNKDILLVKKGDKITGRYEATDISDQALTITVADTGEKIVIPLKENQPLTSIK